MLGKTISHKENANPNYKRKKTGYYQKLLVRMRRKKKFLYTAIGNVN
jgi:hypothetical protein